MRIKYIRKFLPALELKDSWLTDRGPNLLRVEYSHPMGCHWDDPFDFFDFDDEKITHYGDPYGDSFNYEYTTYHWGVSDLRTEFNCLIIRSKTGGPQFNPSSFPIR
jgi:hypothetical protein